MTKFYNFSLSIQFFISFFAAEVFYGEKVTEATNGEFTSVVSLGKAPDTFVRNHFCTGTLISKRHVLTAAHCLEVDDMTESFMKPGGIVVTVGSIDVTQGTKYEVQKWKTFEEWTAEKNIPIVHYFNTEYYHDVAVITLVNNIVEDIKPAHLSSLKHKNVYNKDVVAAGWGVTGSNTSPRYLRRIDLQVIDRRTCRRNLNVTGYSPDLVLNHFCTIEKRQATLGCGDSGGPIFVNGDEIIGVNVGDCADYGHPNHVNLHAAVKYYRKFIRSIINPKSSCTKSANEVYSLEGFYNDNIE